MKKKQLAQLLQQGMKMNSYQRIKGILSSAFGIAVLFAANQACATVVDFEDVGYTYLQQGQAFTSGGFTLTEGNGEYAFAQVLDNSGQGGTSFSGNGTNRLLGFNDSSFTFASVVNTPFNLLAFDGGKTWLSGSGATQISVTGYTVSGAQVSQVFDLDQIESTTNGLQTLTLNDSFKNLSSAVFVGTGAPWPEFTLDNITTSAVTAGAVPEPTSIALLGLGLAGIGALRRKSKQHRA
jgi:hypothetical protein